MNETKEVKLLSGWHADECYDPSHSMMEVEFGGEVWQLHETAQGYGFTARPLPYNAVNARRLTHAYSLDELQAKLNG